MSLPVLVVKIYQNQKLLLTFIFLLSLFVSTVFLFVLGNVGPVEHGVPGSDYSGFYKPLAENILAGKGFILGDGKNIDAPGYPFFLALIFLLARFLQIGELQLIVFFNLLLTAVSACLLYLLAKHLFDKKIALVASFLWLTYPFSLWFIKNPNTEVPFIVLFFLGLWLYLSALKKEQIRLIFLTGLILGVAALVRPSAWLFVVLAIIIFLLTSWNKSNLRISLTKRIGLVTFLIIGALVIILPWEVYVFSETGRLIPLATGGGAAMVDGLTFGLRTGAAGDQVVLPGDVLALMERAKGESLLTIPQVLQFLGTELVEEPLAFFKLIGLKILRSWYATSQMWWEGRILLVQLVYLSSGLAGLIYSLRRYKEKIKEIIFMLAVISYFWALAIIALSILRYMVPAMGLVFIFSAIFAVALIERLVKNSKTPSL